MSDPGNNPMPVVGYADRLSVAPGDTIQFKVSCDLPSYHAQIVRIRHASANPKGPGRKEEMVQTSVTGDYPGKKEEYRLGSYVFVPLEGRPSIAVEGFSIQAWVLPSMPARGLQCLASGVSRDGSSFGLFLHPENGVELRITDSSGAVRSVHAGRAMRPGQWAFVAGSYDSGTGRCTVVQSPVHEWPDDESSARAEGHVKEGPLGRMDGWITIGARREPGPGLPRSTQHFNGKIQAPRFFSRPLSALELEELRLGVPISKFRDALLGAWDFSLDIMSTKVSDVSGLGLDGITVNNPKRAVTGHDWTGAEVDFRRTPNEYAAIYFHEDDLEDCEWETDFEFRVPLDFPTGIYAASLSTGVHTDYVPFFVRPRPDGPKSRIAFLIPTLSYMAYANFHAVDNIIAREYARPGFRYPVAPIDKYLVKTNLKGFYDLHIDLTGVNYVSRRMPLMDIRPDFEDPLLDLGRGGMHQFPADTCLTDWLDVKGFHYDIITDEDLHAEGVDLLKPYRVVLTGSHPEYYTEKMLDAMEAYLKGGGRMMYLGGNGFYWVTSIDPVRPHIIELRRWGGTQGWRTQPGEYYHSTTGELGGLWRNRGRAPQRLVGVGFTCQGIDNNVPYRRMPGSFDPKVAFVFEGIGKDELIGDFENLVNERGAGGFEVDRLDYKLGTSPKAFLLATARGFSDAYQAAIEDVDEPDSKQSGSVSPFARADIVYQDYPKKGAVFSVGSISWVSCLSYNRYDNNVSRMTENVLRRFVAD
ncbi:MAG: LamG domain-containing protein [Thaumarchaeota archaeon]|nr:LamG domain-containing protein [Nitrososphaerota archaeon]